MPELPDIEVYRAALERHVKGELLGGFRIASPFVLRSVKPSPAACVGRVVTNVSRLGKRLVFELEGEHFVVVHLMIAGRLRWKPPLCAISRKLGLAAWDFAAGSVLLTEAGTKRRASIHVVGARKDLDDFSRGGLDVRSISLAEFSARLRLENHTLKRTLSDPRLFDGIGNAYSDEILHAARLSPLALSRRLDDDAAARLYDAARETLTKWIERLLAETGDGFPDKVTAFRADMAVHGRYGLPCPACGQPVQRIVYAENECNYCAVCQTGGRVLADRALSRLLREDWPRTLDELENLRRRG